MVLAYLVGQMVVRKTRLVKTMAREVSCGQPYKKISVPLWQSDVISYASLGNSLFIFSFIIFVLASLDSHTSTLIHY